MKTVRYLTGVLLIALVVAATILGLGALFNTLALTEGQVATLAPAAQAPIPFTIDIPLSGSVKLEWAAPGTLFDELTPPSAQEQADLPDLGAFDLAIVLQREDAFFVDGFVDIETSYVFTGHHTIQTTVLGETKTLQVGPKVGGSYDAGEFILISDRFSQTTQAGDTLERQFGLWLESNATPGVLVGGYRETVWGIGLQPVTVVGTFTLRDLNISLASTNQAPVASQLAVNTTPNTPVAVTLSGSDPDDDPITYIIVTQPLKGTLSGTAPNLTYTPANNFQGLDSFTYRVNDGQLNSDTVAVTIQVTATPPPPNTPPVANPQTVSAVTGQPRAITLTGSDADGDSLTYSIVKAPTHGTLTGTGPNRVYTANAGFVGQDSFTFRVNDRKVNSPAATVTLNVTAAPTQNTPPVANAQTVSAVAGQAKAIALTGTDADANTLTYSIVTQPSNGTLTGSGANHTYTANSGFEGQDSFTFKVNDGTVDSPPATVVINVKAVAPVDDDIVIQLPLVRR